MKTIFSAIQPTNNLTIGNYIALKSFMKRQENKCYFSVADLHALTIPRDPKELADKVRRLYALFLVAGVDRKKSTLFVQSHVSAHSELSWIITCSSYMGELNRMTQFKDKSHKMKSIPTGIFVYPNLMAADILLYDTDIVPVGADQKQHVEITRDLAERINAKYGKVFTIPKPEIAKLDEGSKIMSLDDPENKKMSKSNPNLNSKIGMDYSAKQIKTAISKAVTDSEGVIRFDTKAKAGISNLMIIHSQFSHKSIAEIEKHYSGVGYGEFKKDIINLITEEIQETQKQIEDLIKSSDLDKYMKEGKEEAEHKANAVLSRVQQAMGLKSSASKF